MSEFSTSGHIGSFNFGDYTNVSNPTSGVSINVSATGTVSTTVSATDQTYISIDVSDKDYAIAYKELYSTFVAKKESDSEYPDCGTEDITIRGGNPVIVDFKACTDAIGDHSNYEPIEYKWWFDYGNNSDPSDAVVTTDETTQYTYCGDYGQEYDVRLCTTFSSGSPLTEKTVCYDREGLVVTYGLDELKYGQDRTINLVNYLPDYVKNTDVETVLQEFEDYLNDMYEGQKNYTWTDGEIDVKIYDTPENKQWTSCNDIEACSGTCSATGRGDCTNYASSAVENTYNFTGSTSAGVPVNYTTITPADTVGEVFVNNVCGITKEKISILDKIFRLTDLFDPDLMPEDMIQYYAANLGYQAGINRDSFTATAKNTETEALEQKRYLRFMIRNLPNWYQIKTTRSAIKIMLYSFGLIGDFVYYYTKCYSDINTEDDTGYCGLSKDTESTSTSATSVNDCDKFPDTCCNLYDSENCEDYLGDTVTSEDIAKYRSCASKYRRTIDKWASETEGAYGNTGDDWLLTEVDLSSTREDLSPIPEDKGYFSSPHFKMWINLDESAGNYSTDSDRQRMIKTAVNAIKPINMVFDGVAAKWETRVIMYMKPYERVRKPIQIYSTSATYTSASPAP